MSHNNISINAICRFFVKNNDYVVFVHENPDADAIGSACALVATLRAIGKRAHVVSYDKIPNSLTFLTDGIRDFSFDALPRDFTPGVYVSTDVASPGQLGGYRDYASKVSLSLDHHATHDRFAEMTFIDPMAAACAEIVYRIVNRLLIGELSKETASMLYAALAADTGGFRYANTTQYTHKIAARLIELGADHTQICHNLFECKSKAALAAEAFAMANVMYRCDGLIATVRITLADKARYGFEDEDTYDVINAIRRADGVKIAIFAREREPGQYKISTRSACEIDVAKICAIFGGGGHPGAAGCSVSENELDSAVETIIKECGFQ